MAGHRPFADANMHSPRDATCASAPGLGAAITRTHRMLAANTFNSTLRPSTHLHPNPFFSSRRSYTRLAYSMATAAARRRQKCAKPTCYRRLSRLDSDSAHCRLMRSEMKRYEQPSVVVPLFSFSLSRSLCVSCARVFLLPLALFLFAAPHTHTPLSSSDG